MGLYPKQRLLCMRKTVVYGIKRLHLIELNKAKNGVEFLRRFHFLLFSFLLPL